MTDELINCDNRLQYFIETIIEEPISMHQHEIIRKISNSRSRHSTIQKKIIRMLKINPWIYTANKEVLA